MEEEIQNRSEDVVHTASSVISGKRKSLLRSNVWSGFKDIHGTDRVECLHCGKDYKCDKSKTGTSTLRKHLEKCMKNPSNSKKQKTLAFEKLEGIDGKLVTVSFDPKECRIACAKYIICGELSFRHVETWAFKMFCFQLQPKFNPPSRTTLTRDCYQLYKDMKIKLGRSIKKHCVSLTTDTWRSIQNINYMCVTAHFIDKGWVLHKRLINFFQVPNHKGETVSRELETCLREWKIKKLCAITVDNASSNDAALNSLKKKLSSSADSIVLEGNLLHLRCSAHIINLIVNEGLKEIETSVVRIRLACKYVRSSTVRQQSFEECCANAGIETKALLCLDVTTRWNSTYLMLDTAVKFQMAFDRMVGDGNYDNYFKEENEISPTDDDWEQAREYIDFLKTFYTATKKFSGSSYATSNLFLPEIFDISQKLDKMINQPNGNPSHCLMAIRMKQKFNKYWGDAQKINDLLFMAAVLDPRFKFKLLKHFYAKCQKPPEYVEVLCQRVEKLLKDFFCLYDKENPQSSTSSNKQSTPIVPVHPEDEDQESDLFSEYADPDDFSSSKHEVDKYLNDQYEPYTRQFDILSWWRLNGHKYPILSHIARDILCVQVSTVSSESAFSGGGRILDSFRSSLHPRMVEALMCTRDWVLANHLSPIMDEECREELDNFMHSQSILAEMETLSTGSNSGGEHLSSSISISKEEEDDGSEADSD